MLNKKVSHGRLRGEKYSSAGGNKKAREIPHIRIREKVSTAGSNSKKNQIILDDYMSFIKETQMGDRHHWLTKGKYGTLDCFIVCIHPDIHTRIHHGDIGAQGYIEQEGFIPLVIESMRLMYSYLDYCRTINSGLADVLTLFISEVTEDPESALYIAQEYSERIKNEVK